MFSGCYTALMTPFKANFELDYEALKKLIDFQLAGGVRIVHDDLVKALAGHGVQRIQPRRGDEFDPNRHQAMLREPAEDLEPNRIVYVLQPGYLMGDLVLRPAKVAVTTPADEG